MYIIGRVDRKIVLKCYLKGTGWEDVYWIDPTQVSDKWRAVMNMAVTISVP